MDISLIAAVADHQAIGHNNTMPWHLPEDLRHFKSLTLGKPVIMGRKTFQTLKKPLPGRTNIVITRDDAWHHDGVRVAHNLHEALDVGRDIAFGSNGKEVMVIGGAEIYRQALPICHRIYLTRIYQSFVADTFFPELDNEQWNEVSREEHLNTGEPRFRYAFLVLERVHL